MNMQRRPGKYSRGAYQDSQKSLQQRLQQPSPRPWGNYRVDSDGNPILPDFQRINQRKSPSQEDSAQETVQSRRPHQKMSNNHSFQSQPEKLRDSASLKQARNTRHSWEGMSPSRPSKKPYPIQQGRLVSSSQLARDSSGPRDVSRSSPGNYRIDLSSSVSDSSQTRPSQRGKDGWFHRLLDDGKTTTKDTHQPTQAIRPVHRHEYDSSMNTWQGRSQQPRFEEEVQTKNQASSSHQSRKNYKYDPRRRDKQNDKANLGPFQKKASLKKGSHKWYYDLQNQTFRRGKQHRSSSNLYEHLPNQRLKLLAVFVGIATIFILCFKDLLPYNRINHIQVAGNDMVSSQEIIQASKLHHLDRVDRVYAQEKDIKKMMKKSLPMLDTINFERKNWQTLQVNVTEYDMIALMESQGVITPVLSSGELLSFEGQNVNGEYLRGELPLLADFDQKSKISDLSNNALRKLDEDTLQNIEKISYVQDTDKQNAIIVDMKDGNQVHAIINTFAQKMAYYPQMIDQLEGRKGIINLEVGAYFTPE